MRHRTLWAYSSLRDWYLSSRSQALMLSEGQRAVLVTRLYLLEDS